MLNILYKVAYPTNIFFTIMNVFFRKAIDSRNHFLPIITSWKGVFRFLFSVLSLQHKQYFIAGKMVFFAGSDNEIAKVSLEEFLDHLQTASITKIHLWIGQPFVNTYLHETIPLLPKELAELDKRVLKCSASAPQDRKVISFPLHTNMSVTLHTHLTKEGLDLCAHLKKQKIAFSWESIIGLGIQYFQQKPTDTITPNLPARLFKGDEVLQTNPGADKNRFIYLPFLNTLQKIDPEQRGEAIDSLIGKDQHSGSIADIHLEDLLGDRKRLLPLVSKNFFRNKLSRLMNTKKNPGTKWDGRKERRKITFRPKPVLIAAVSFLILLLWSINLQFQIIRNREERDTAIVKLQRLSEQTRILDQLKATEKQYYHWMALRETLRELSISPSTILEKIDIVLTNQMWLEEIQFNKRGIQVHVLASKNIEIADFMEKLQQRPEFKMIQLEENRTYNIHNTTLQRYILKVKNRGVDDFGKNITRDKK